ncbi:Collectin-12 [Nibea albiflora]|uniref:Collectin-12 n=1 Tax=Nibea albiflora TaxID=240163 RepID=A0ACB7FLP4_NIBAL|nr:Collectin-12 [Nibea albiflora]
MAVFFRPSDSGVNIEVGEYQEFPRPEPEDAPTETPKPKLRLISVVLLSFGLLCVLQGILNISLRLARTVPTDKAWVGMTDREREGDWVWVDGTPLDEDMLEWATGQPDGAYGGEDCADLRTMKNFIGLNDFNCSSRMQWICEKTLL